MTIRDWITSPIEWEGFGTRMNAWMNELVRAVNTLETDVDTLETDVAAATTVSHGTPTFASGWADFGSVFGPPLITKSPDGMVTIELMASNTSGAIKAANATIFTLPAGYRPQRQLIVPGTKVGNTYSRLTIFTSGVVSSSDAIAIAGWVSSSGVSFYAGN